MHLIGVREEDGWAVSRWELTYPAGWLNIQKAVESLYDYYSAVKVFVRDKEVDVKKAEDIKEGCFARAVLSEENCHLREMLDLYIPEHPKVLNVQ